MLQKPSFVQRLREAILYHYGATIGHLQEILRFFEIGINLFQHDPCTKVRRLKKTTLRDGEWRIDEPGWGICIFGCYKNTLLIPVPLIGRFSDINTPSLLSHLSSGDFFLFLNHEVTCTPVIVRDKEWPRALQSATYHVIQ